ncbi:alpha/beta hydrolase [Prosthecobacter sp.]|uniref:alpha/beta hydrolase n=1 Tax=Prosthecobacter sp. TaxID=1965333 RepID=UPI003784367C
MKPVLLLFFGATMAGAEPLVQNLWPAAPPGPASQPQGEERDLTKPEDKLIAGRRIIKLGHVSTPQMHVYLPPKDKANGGAVLVCPGGGFTILAWDLEGTEIAEWLNTLGFAAVVVKYRVPTGMLGDALDESGVSPLRSLGPLMDAQRAVSLTRAHAKDWGLDPARIGIMGFSAGGATAGLCTVHGEKRAYAKTDASDEQSCAPNFALLIYPAGFVDKETGALRTHLKVSKDMPPVFFVMAEDDHVDCDNCTVLFTALKHAKVPAELHIYTHGGHGYGLRPTELPVTRWPARAAEWLQDMGLNKKAAP